MTVGGSILLHGEKWAATLEDKFTVQHIRNMLVEAIEEHTRIAMTITDEQFAEEFDKLFEDDLARCFAVINTCNERLENWK